MYSAINIRRVVAAILWLRRRDVASSIVTRARVSRHDSATRYKSEATSEGWVKHEWCRVEEGGEMILDQSLDRTGDSKSRWPTGRRAQFMLKNQTRRGEGDVCRDRDGTGYGMESRGRAALMK